MLKCPECGYLSFEDEKSCPKCGIQLSMPEQGEETNAFLQPPIELLNEKEKQEFSDEPPVEIPASKPAHSVVEPTRINEEAPAIAPEQNSVPVETETRTAQQDLPIRDQITPEGIQKELHTKKERLFSFGDEKNNFKKKFLKTTQRDDYLFFFYRFSGFIIDNVITVFLTSLFIYISLLISRRNFPSMADLVNGTILPSYLLFILIHLYYHTFFLTITGQTPGKALTGLKVVGPGGLKLEWHEAFIRSLGYFLSIAPAGAGVLWSLLNPRNETWHDKLSGSRVIKTVR